MKVRDTIRFSVIEPGFEILTPVDQIAQFPRLTEIAGRTCYKSEDKITPESAARFVRMLVKSGHESVLEHCSITVRVIGDRTMSHQLVRHRIAAYSQESQRYCNYGKLGMQVVCPPAIGVPTGAYEWDKDGCIWFHEGSPVVGEKWGFAQCAWLRAVREAVYVYENLLDTGVKAEDARSVLPGCTKTEVVATFDMRTWRHVFRERALNRAAQWQIRGIMLAILVRFRELLPDFFFDLGEDER